MRSMLEMLRRKRAAANLDSRQLLMLNNAYYQCNPPKRKAIEQKKREPLELYIRHLIYHVLAKKSVDSVVMQLRKLPWDDPLSMAGSKMLSLERGAFGTPTFICLQFLSSSSTAFTQLSSSMSSIRSWRTSALAWRRTSSSTINAVSLQLAT